MHMAFLLHNQVIYQENENAVIASQRIATEASRCTAVCLGQDLRVGYCIQIACNPSPLILHTTKIEDGRQRDESASCL